jgi:hypothetical protein
MAQQHDLPYLSKSPFLHQTLIMHTTLSILQALTCIQSLASFQGLGLWPRRYHFAVPLYRKHQMLSRASRVLHAVFGVGDFFMPLDIVFLSGGWQHEALAGRFVKGFCCALCHRRGTAAGFVHLPAVLHSDLFLQHDAAMQRLPQQWQLLWWAHCCTWF